jgi:cytochrome c biogenesis protein CcmG/thiol:disulfide interchange protein DsbE
MILVLAALLTAACSSSVPDPSFVRLSGPMPPIVGTTLDGRPFGPGDYGGKVVVVNFWNQDCPPCRDEQPVLQADQTDLQARGVIVVGLLYVGGNWPNDVAAARSFLASNGVTYPNLLDAGSELSRAFRIGGIPTTVVADRSGQLRFQILGRVRSGQLQDLIDQIDEG